MIIGQPKKISPAFNNLYIYASSSNILETNFKYRAITAVSTLQNPLEVIGDKTIEPRYGDDLLEYNVNKVVQAKLGDLTDDIDFNDAPQTIFINTESSGVDFVVGVSDRFQYGWDFSGVTTSFLGNIYLEGTEDPIYVPGDVILVDGLADYYPYSQITSGPNNYAKFTLTEPHNLNTGDFVLVNQNSPFSYPIYNGYYEVLIATNPLELVLNILYQGGSQLSQTGTIVYNDNLDGTAIVVNAGGSFPNYFVELGLSGTQSFLGLPLVISTTQSGTTKFIDSRLSEFPNSITRATTVFNGGMDRKDWLNYEANEYSTLIDGFKFLTNLPNNWTAKLDNDYFLNFWNYGLSYDYLDLKLTTKDCNGVVIDEYLIPYDGTTASTIQTISVGPAHINEICPTVQYLLNSGFWDDSEWILTADGNCTASISDGGLIYDFTGVGGVGRVRARQNGVLTIGENYNVCFEVEPSFVGTMDIFINQIGLVATGSGDYCFNFTASTADFIFTMEGLSGTPFAKIDFISVTNSVCDILDCNVCSYDIQLDSRASDDRNQIFPLAVENAWDIFNLPSPFNGFTFIEDGELKYTDLVEFGGPGGSLITQECVYTEGENYTIRVNISNNSNVVVNAGEVGNLFPIGTTGSTGTFTASFTASNSTFLLTMGGVATASTNGAVIDSIEVFLNGTFTASSEIFNFEIDCECEGRYTNYPIIFKDRMGSFVTYNFDLNNRQRVNIIRENYDRFVGGLKPDNSCKGGSYRYSLNESGRTIFSTLLEEQWEMNADAMTEEESIFFEELVSSPRAAIKIDGDYYAINIIDNQYERVRKNNEKMIYHKLFISFSNNNPIQSL
jgi:hypothetical protein